MAASVVIGAGSGMGAAVARRLVAHGPLVLADRDGDRLAAVHAEVVKAAAPDAEVRAAVCDITDLDSVAALARGIDDLEALVLTAGLSPSMGPGREIYRVNLIATDAVVTAFAPRLRPGSAGVLFASMAGHLLPVAAEVASVLDAPGSPTFFDDLASVGVDVDEPHLAYVYSKAGVIRLARRRALEWGAAGARLVSLSPGIIDTPMGQAEARAEPAMASMVEGSPLGRMARADELAAVAAFLVSSEASFLTATDVLVDGGAVAAMAAGSP